MARIIMEQVFESPLTDADLAARAKRLDECLDLRDGIWCRSYLSQDRKRIICEFEAPDAETVREAQRSAGGTFERVWNATVFGIEDYPELMKKRETLRARVSAR